MGGRVVKTMVLGKICLNNPLGNSRVFESRPIQRFYGWDLCAGAFIFCVDFYHRRGIDPLNRFYLRAFWLMIYILLPDFYILGS